MRNIRYRMSARARTERRLRRRLSRLLRVYGLKKGAVTLAVVGNAEMEEVRERLIALPQFKGKEASKIKKEETINVLAFPEPEHFPHPESREKVYGEVYLNFDMAKGEYELLAWWLVHGFLHLQGFRHVSVHDRMRMERMESRLLGKL